MPRRFHPRFSVRALAIFVTLVCAYFGAWEATKRYGTASDPELKTLDSLFLQTPAPFLIVQDESDPAVKRAYGSRYHPYVRRYYLWFFGLTARLPIETNCPDSSRIWLTDPFG